MKAVFLDRETFNKSISIDCIKQQVSEIVCYQTTSTDQVIARCKDAEIIITNKVTLDTALLSQLTKLKLICISATGYNNVDIKAAQRLNIAVTNVTGYASASVAQYVFAQILDYYQQTSYYQKVSEQGLWSSSDTFCYHGNPITELSGKTLGIIGFGNLGQAVANLAQAFGMNILISERVNSQSIRADRVSFEQLLKSADIISLHCPQTPDTEGLINKQALSQVKPTAMLINTARGALIDNEALFNALKNNELAYAVLDVLEQEPPPENHPLLVSQLANLKITAHIAWASTESQQRLIDLLSENIAAFTLGQRLNRLD